MTTVKDTYFLSDFKLTLMPRLILLDDELKTSALRGYYTPNQKLTCFVLYLKIINTFLKNNVCIFKQIV